MNCLWSQTTIAGRGERVAERVRNNLGLTVLYGSYNQNENPADKAPDYQFWLQRDYWKLPEAAKLICGRDPMAKFTGRPRYNTTWRVIDIIDHAFLAVQDGKLNGDRSALLPVHVMVTPQDFLDWAKSNAFEIPGPLQDSPETAPMRKGATAAAAGSELFEARLVAIVARTLQLACPELTFDQIARHQAMQIVGGIKTPQQQKAVLQFLKESL